MKKILLSSVMVAVMSFFVQDGDARIPSRLKTSLEDLKNRIQKHRHKEVAEEPKPQKSNSTGDFSEEKVKKADKLLKKLDGESEEIQRSNVETASSEEEETPAPRNNYSKLFQEIEDLLISVVITGGENAGKAKEVAEKLGMSNITPPPLPPRQNAADITEEEETPPPLPPRQNKADSQRATPPISPSPASVQVAPPPPPAPSAPVAPVAPPAPPAPQAVQQQRSGGITAADLKKINLKKTDNSTTKDAPAAPASREDFLAEIQRGKKLKTREERDELEKKRLAQENASSAPQEKNGAPRSTLQKSISTGDLMGELQQRLAVISAANSGSNEEDDDDDNNEEWK